MPKPPKVVLTPEEKKALKAAQKAELLRLEELKLRQDQHDFLSREVKYGKLNIKLHEKNWRKMLLKIALPRMHEDLRFAWHNFERTVDAKDFTISILMDEICDAEQQYMINLRSHSENIDTLVTKFKDQLNELEHNSFADLDAMQFNAEQEVDQLKKSAADAEEYLKTMIFGLAVKKREQEQLVRGDYLSKLDEESTKYTDIIQHLRGGLENTFGSVWQNTKTFLDDYAAQTTDRRKAYNVLSQQDIALQKLCNEQRFKLSDMQEYLNKLKVNFVNVQETQGQKISDLLNERQYFADAFWTLRTRLISDKKIDNENLALLTVESNVTKAHLEKILKKGKHLLELAAICRKLETQEEKILPFPSRSGGLSSSFHDIDLEEYKHVADLELFWKRFAQADAVRHSINEEREYLKRQNKILQTKIHEYCQCLDCPAYDLNRPQKESSGNINVTDGNLMQQNYNKQLKYLYCFFYKFYINVLI